MSFEAQLNGGVLYEECFVVFSRIQNKNLTKKWQSANSCFSDRLRKLQASQLLPDFNELGRIGSAMVKQRVKSKFVKCCEDVLKNSKKQSLLSNVWVLY